MGMNNFIKLAVSSVLKNPILGVLREINISKIPSGAPFLETSLTI